MWSKTILCLLVGLAYASNNPAWKENSEYVYQVRGRSLASLDQISNDYSGIVLKAKLTVRPRSDGNLDGKISEAQYAQIHAQLEKGWDSRIPESKLSYKQLPISPKPFQMVLSEGALRDLIVDKEISNWEANMIKSIVSQLQLDTKAQNLIPSHINTLNKEGSNTANSAVYKTMEETVTGVAETLYEIHPLPKFVLQSDPWLAPMRQLSVDGDFIEVVKTKNFTHSEERPSYHFGLQGIPGHEPTNNKIGNFFTRSSVSRAVITGDLNRYTIQSAVTVDQIVLSPTMTDKQRGSVNTMVNVTLLNVLQQSDRWEQPSNPVNTGLVYRFNKPFESSNEPRQGQEYDHQQAPGSYESNNSGEHSARSKRSMSNRNYLSRSFRFDSQDHSSEEEYWQQEQPKLDQAPESPLLPFTVGYNGKSIKQKQDVVETARKLAEKIGQEVQRPQEIQKQNTVGKFLILSSLLRTMNAQEMQQVAGKLYNNQKHGPQAAAWKAYRDAVAQAGTGPALITIKEWIKNDKISHEEAAQVVSTASKSARQPTQEYMKAFFEMIKDDQIMHQSSLNQSALLSYTKLVYQVYVNKDYAHNKYPVHSFGAFRTEQGKEFVKKVVIPHLTQKLHEYVAQADTKRIHAYIRALGNVGQRHILEAFEPYLEGQKQASHFQRVLMVVALDKLARNNPKVARSVLYKIYQNPSEYEQVRVAAVYQLMRTNPSPAMLQRMASYTNVDPNHYVNAAVQSAIQSAAQLQGPHHQAQLRSAAQSAKHLLTSQQYGVQYSQQHLRSYIVDQMKLSYQQDAQTYGGADYILPKGIKYTLQQRFGGVKEHLINMHAMVSSIDDLINVFQQQTSQYQQQQREKQSHNPAQHQWSSEHIAQLLNMDNEQREQLEGNLYVHIADLHKIWSFDNQTLENLPRSIQELEQKLRNGQHFDYNKMIVGHETVVAFPTALGLPFIYTYDRPTIVKVETNIKASANPPVSSGDSLHRPNTVESEFEIRAFVSGRVQSQLAFITPFDNQRYSAGYQKNFQIIVPIAGYIQLDTQKEQLRVELENPQQQEQDAKLLHFSTKPYTAKNDIFNPNPEMQVIRKKHPAQVINQVMGQKATGIAFNVHVTCDQRIDFATVYEKLHRHDLVSAILSPWMNENIHYMKVSVSVNSQQSTTKKIAVQVGYQHQYFTDSNDDSNDSDGSRFKEFPEDPLERQKEFLKRASAGIKNGHVAVADATLLFQGQKQIKYIATLAGSKSNVDPKGRFLALFKQDNKQGQPLRLYIDTKTHVPNTNGLDLDYAMQMDTTSKAHIQAILTGSDQKPSKIQARIEFAKSEQRKQHLKEQPEYQECQQQMQQGNHQLPICAKMTAKANLLDQFKIQVNYDDIDQRIVNQTYKLYSLLRHALYPRLEEDIVSNSQKSQQGLDIQGQFSPDLKSFNFSINSEYGRAEARNVKVNGWAKSLLVPHPVFHVRSRLMAHAYRYDTYRPICVVDKTAASTFDNKTYPLDLGNEWTVLMQYVPRRPYSNQQRQEQPVPEQLKEHIESYVIFIRDSEQGSSQRALKMVVQTPGTQGKIIEIALKPQGSSNLPALYVDQKEIKYENQESSDVYNNYMQVYALPNNEVKLEMFNAYYIIFDGERVKLTITNNKFRDATRGLCGTFTGEPETDFTSPDNCILRQPEEFVASYTISQKQSRPIRQMKSQEQCYQKTVVPANYISSQDAGRSQSADGSAEYNSGSSCTRLQTQYAVQGDETCFTLRPLPICKQGCRQNGSISKNVPVHCVRSTSATDLWKNEIKKGASPDFSLKSQSRTIRMQVPQRCLA